MKTARFVIDPRALMDEILPIGNEIVGVAVTEDGLLVFEFSGVDVPTECQEIPMLSLMVMVDAAGLRETWFEDRPPIREPKRRSRKRASRTTST